MKIAVIGVGNILFMDEGVGVYASRMLKENYLFEPEVEIVDGGTLGFKLMDYFEEYDRVVILDTVSIDDRPGSVYDLPAEALMGLGDYRKTVHEVEVVGMLEICSMLDKTAEVSVMGIIPEDIQTVEINGTNWHRVRIGPYSNVERVREIQQKLKQNSIDVLLLKVKG